MKNQIILSENYPFSVVKFSIYLNRCVFVMIYSLFVYSKCRVVTYSCLFLFSYYSGTAGRPLTFTRITTELFYCNETQYNLNLRIEKKAFA